MANPEGFSENGDEENMKVRLLCVFSLLLLVLPWAAMAAQKNAVKVNFSEPVTVGNTVLNAGDYRVKWEGTGSAVQVTFLQGKNQIATVPATITGEVSRFDATAVEVRDGSDHSKVLEKILLKDVVLNFEQPTATTATK